MPKRERTKRVARSLPYVQVAAFCELILVEQDNVWSCIRIFDRINIAQPAPPPPPLPADAKPFVSIRAAIMLKSGKAKGKKTVRLVPESPESGVGEIVETPAVFNGDEQGVNVHAIINFRVDGEGLYWCNVYVNEELLTRMPLRIGYTARASASPTEGARSDTAH